MDKESLAGFDITPRLDPHTEDKQNYKNFLQEVVSAYRHVDDPEVLEARVRQASMMTESELRGYFPPGGKVLMLPDDPIADYWCSGYVRLVVGHVLEFPADPEHCHWFLSIRSQVSGLVCSHTQKYIEEVQKIAEKHFGKARVHGWNDHDEFLWQRRPLYTAREMWNARDILLEQMRKNRPSRA